MPIVQLRFVLLVFAFVLFVLAALPYAPAAPYWNRLTAAGLACCVAAMLVGLL